MKESFSGENIFTWPRPQAGPSHGIDVSACLRVCMFAYLSPFHIFYHDGCPTRPTYLGPPIFLQIPDPYKMTIRGAD